ncbi:adenosylcobinamide-phosphate synthase CbiB [Haloarcula argentinensis]|uniref:Probable cobalamin biosynthesis protein CobD n=1 Tax=Haloarcula argentinensis TaxID=43776 RepID=A0ABU2F177_HALAR|nr:adenosylcobinamide-phosphate synthase CbiB [Haloarcula argentinensis]EMA19212.1 cobalamin biosynthesis protein CobD [Haloarcula argentinensis DSM 12282]MDS0254297.1 adenosylcobinamide-phosphate synthase CbiB [Haloarcula argentinensis]
MLNALAVAVAGGLELAIGEPPTRLHPVAWFGRLVGTVDREWDHPLAVGGLAAALLPLGVAVVVGGSVALAATREPMAAVVLAGLVLFLTTSLRSLLTTARGVIADSDADLPAARDGLLALAGRDASALSAGEVRSAAVESTSENLADGLVASLAAFVVGGLVAAGASLPPLPVAAGTAAWVKAVNTMDSMLGYRSKRVGTPAARLDDAVMWLPARLSALLLALACGSPRSVARARAWLDGVPSPNSGWPMGTAAAALDVRLEKPGVYVLNPAGGLPDMATAQRSVTRVGVAGVLAYLLAGLGVLAWF